jgi:manganese-dependent inorganic pyrophosphatase
MCLVDHNEDFQAPDNLSELDIAWVIDHHKMDFKTATPLNMRVEAICSTASILYKMYKEAGFEISKEISTMMLACVLSDSLLFKSATTTKEDTIIAKELQEITGITDLEAFAMPMFNAKSDL